jgi:hypothetical protein
MGQEACGSPWVFEEGETVELLCVSPNCKKHLGMVSIKPGNSVEVRINCKKKECKKVNVIKVFHDEAGRLVTQTHLEPKPMMHLP